MTKFYVNTNGNYIGGFDGAQPPTGSVEVPNSPPHGSDLWNGSAFVPLLATTKTAKLAQLEQARDAAERVNVTVGGKVYSASEAFQAKVSRAINQTGRGKPIAGANDAWRTADMQPVVMTAALLGLIEDAITAQSAAAWARFGLRFDAVDAAFKANDRAALEVVVW